MEEMNIIEPERAMRELNKSKRTKICDIGEKGYALSPQMTIVFHYEALITQLTVKKPNFYISTFIDVCKFSD